MKTWNIFRVTGHLCGEFTGDQWIPHTKASYAELWCVNINIGLTTVIYISAIYHIRQFPGATNCEMIYSNLFMWATIFIGPIKPAVHLYMHMHAKPGKNVDSTTVHISVHTTECLQLQTKMNVISLLMPVLLKTYWRDMSHDILTDVDSSYIWLIFRAIVLFVYVSMHIHVIVIDFSIFYQIIPIAIKVRGIQLKWHIVLATNHCNWWAVAGQ